jgi:hypothetical protein
VNIEEIFLEDLIGSERGTVIKNFNELLSSGDYCERCTCFL